jgi:hypothetical protein
MHSDLRMSNIFQKLKIQASEEEDIFPGKSIHAYLGDRTCSRPILDIIRREQ